MKRRIRIWKRIVQIVDFTTGSPEVVFTLTHDPKKGLAMAISKYFFDNKGYFNDVFKKWMPEDDVLVK